MYIVSTIFSTNGYANRSMDLSSKTWGTNPIYALRLFDWSLAHNFDAKVIWKAEEWVNFFSEIILLCYFIGTFFIMDSLSRGIEHWYNII